MHHHHHLGELAMAGALAFGAYELYHLHKYGNFGIGNPNHHGITFGSPSGYGDPMTALTALTGTGMGGTYGYGNPTYGHHHGHHHSMF